MAELTEYDNTEENTYGVQTMKLPDKRVKIYDLCFAVGFALMLVFLIWKAPFGFQGKDEPFYLTIPYRMMQGDSLITDEWHVTQLSAFLLYPIVRLYAALGGTGEGILLAFRYIYVAVQAATAAYIWLRLRRVNAPGGIAAALLFMVFAPNQLMALSYNTMGFALMTAAGLTMALGKRRVVSCFVSGLMLAGAVLCCPQLAALYLIYSVCVLLVKLSPRAAQYLDFGFSGKEWLCLTAGAGVIAIVFAVVVLSSAGLDGFLAAIPEILKDPAHPATGVGEKVGEAGRMFKMAYPALWVFAAMGTLLITIGADRGRMRRRGIYALCALLLTAALMHWDVIHKENNFVMLPVNYLGLCAYILTEKKNTRLFRFLFIPGCVYGVCIHFASNTHIYAITSAMCVTCTASLPLIGTLSSELLHDSRERASRMSRVLCAATSAALILALAAQLGIETLLRMRYCFAAGETRTAYMDCVIESGAAKGIKTTRECAGEYYSLLNSTQAVRDGQGKNVLYLTYQTWPYLLDEKTDCGYSAWLGLDYPENVAARLKRYWELHPEKAGSIYIYIDKSLSGQEQETLLSALGQDAASLNDSGSGYIYVCAPNKARVTTP